MTDFKTTQLPDAGSLDGSELVGIVQSGVNVQTSTGAVSNLVNNRTYIQIGEHANGGGETGVAVGYYATSLGPGAVAIGTSSYADGFAPIAVGYRANAPNTGAIALGNQASTSGNYAMAIGMFSTGGGTYSMAIGAYANAEGNCIAIGANSEALPSDAIAVGRRASATNFKTVAIGYLAQARDYGAVAVGANSYAEYKSVAVGYRAKIIGQYSVSIGATSECLANYCIAIGSYAFANAGGAVAVGPYCSAVAASSVALGISSHAGGANSVAVGSGATAQADNSFALGTDSATAQTYSMVIGSSSIDVVMGSLVINGYPVDFALRPADHYQKFIGSTIPPNQASGTWFGSGYGASISYTAGAAGNAFSFISVNPGANNTLGVSFADNVLTISLGTNSGGALDASQNTLTNVAALFPFEGFTLQVTGPGSSVLSNAHLNVNLSGGSDGQPSCILTADGNSPVSANVLALATPAIATLTGRVTAAGVYVFNDEDSAACFVLTPLLLYRSNSAIYHFVGTPTFTLENGSDGTGDWPVPTLAIDGGSGFLQVTVVNELEQLNWMAHFKFETSQ